MRSSSPNPPPSTLPLNGRPVQPASAGVSMTVDAAALAPLVRQIVGEVLAQLDTDAAKVDAGGGGKLAYSEEEAARLLGLEPHVLRDERRRGRIAASQIVGRRIRYTRQDLVDYLAGRRVGAG
jgi:hypothetical protein